MNRLFLVLLILTFSRICSAQEIRWFADVRPAGGAKGALALPSGEVLVARTEGREDGVAIVCAASSDGGRTWQDRAVIASDPDRHTDMGDGNLIRASGRRLLYVYRYNRTQGEHTGRPKYAVKVAESRDDGRTWQPHSTVEDIAPEGPGPSRGLWAPFLLQTSRGELQCYFDDEHTPWQRGFSGHQWVQMKRYLLKEKRWSDPVTVSRAHNPAHLSRDGMATVVELPGGRLLCALESVQVERPHAGVARYVTSDDGGRHWSWRRTERGVLYEPKDQLFLVFAPWLARFPDGTLACVFVTSEDMPEPGVSGTPAHRLKLDVKVVLSHNGGRTWNRPSRLVYAGTHRNYLPGIVVLPRSRSECLVTFLDFDKGFLAIRGRFSAR